MALQEPAKMWATPKGTMPDNLKNTPKMDARGRLLRKTGSDFGMNLADQVKMWTTPNTQDGREVEGKLRPSRTATGRKTDYLSRQVKMWPTPSANEDACGTPDGKMQKMLGNHPGVRAGVAGQLNANWVELLMGFPLGWTDLTVSNIGESPTPESWQDGSWEQGIPRVVKGQKQRVARLKCLGNAVVPQCAEWIGKQLKKSP